MSYGMKRANCRQVKGWRLLVTVCFGVAVILVWAGKQPRLIRSSEIATSERACVRLDLDAGDDHLLEEPSHPADLLPAEALPGLSTSGAGWNDDAMFAWVADPFRKVVLLMALWVGGFSLLTYLDRRTLGYRRSLLLLVVGSPVLLATCWLLGS